MTPIEKDNAEFLQACDCLADKDQLYQLLAQRIAFDVSWGGVQSDAEYEAGCFVSPEPLARAFARRVIVELA